jgi:hypothetical protein
MNLFTAVTGGTMLVLRELMFAETMCSLYTCLIRKAVGVVGVAGLFLVSYVDWAYLIAKNRNTL